MAKKKTKKNAKKTSDVGEDMISVDPAHVRFQHSRIRPVFSGCGRSVTETLESIRRGELSPEELPPIQVLVGPEPWYFSLNNRRLWVLKRCREEGLLKNNQIRVRVRVPKSSAEASRYTVENCALEAKIMRESKPPKSESKEEGVPASENERFEEDNESDKIAKEVEIKCSLRDEKEDNDLSGTCDDNEESSSDEEGPGISNRFSALF